jgi:hypothetical protein
VNGSSVKVGQAFQPDSDALRQQSNAPKPIRSSVWRHATNLCWMSFPLAGIRHGERNHMAVRLESLTYSNKAMLAVKP